MSLKENISIFMEQVTKHIPQETFDMIRADNRRMEQSGIAGKRLKAGDKAPLFVFPNARGELISLAHVFERGSRFTRHQR